MQFRNTRNGDLTTAEPGSKRFNILSRSGRWEAVGDDSKAAESPYDALTVKELEALAEQHGVEVPKNVRKSRLVEIVRDAGISVGSAPVEEESEE